MAQAVKEWSQFWYFEHFARISEFFQKLAPRQANLEPSPDLARLNPNRGTWERIEGKKK